MADSPLVFDFNAVAPGPTITNIVATWGSQLQRQPVNTDIF